MKEEKEFIETIRLDIISIQPYNFCYKQVLNIGIVGAGVGGLSCALIVKKVRT